MSFEEGHVAHPRLYGAPAYARPPIRMAPTVRPIDPDDLPIAAYQTEEERQIVASLQTVSSGVRPVGGAVQERRAPAQRPSLTSRAGRLLGRAS